MTLSCGSPAGDGEVDGVGAGEHRIFISSQTYSGNLNGLVGADAKCQGLASSAGLSKTYKAILSSLSETARQRLSLVGAVYIFDSSGQRQQVAPLGTDLWGSSLSAAIERDENGVLVTGLVWTGTDSDGANAGSTLENCSNWSASSAALNGSIGDSSQTNGFWLEEPTPDSCDSFRRIYCVSQ